MQTFDIPKEVHMFIVGKILKILQQDPSYIIVQGKVQSMQVVGGIKGSNRPPFMFFYGILAKLDFNPKCWEWGSHVPIDQKWVQDQKHVCLLHNYGNLCSCLHKYFFTFVFFMYNQFVTPFSYYGFHTHINYVINFALM